MWKEIKKKAFEIVEQKKEDEFEIRTGKQMTESNVAERIFNDIGYRANIFLSSL